VPLQRRGWSGESFKVTLLSYGYTFVGKGTGSWLEPCLVREADVYGHLHRLQSQTLPVLLGSLDLAPPVEPYRGVKLEHMLFLLWGGVEAWRVDVPHMRLHQEIDRSLLELRREGMRHGDVVNRNILWNKELQWAMIIDFEYSILLVRRALR
jgi:hypothetical protein